MSYNIQVQRVKKSGISEVDFNNLQFGRTFTDHMFEADFYDGEWRDMSVKPLSNISIHPSTFALHYGQSVFEGMKAFRGVDGSCQIFRPEKNWKRLNESAKRMAMQEVPEELFMNALDTLLSIDRDWIPGAEGSSLYIRPFMFASDEYLGVQPGNRFKLIIIASPVGKYYAAPVKVLITDKFVRAVKGGVGMAKAAGNYGAAMYPVKLAREAGFDQILWMDVYEFKWVQEIGTMNVFFQFGDTVATPTLDEGTILDGVTRDSLIQLMIDRGIKVEERRVNIDEIFEHHSKGTLHDAFGAGTAATVAPIGLFGYKDKKYIMPENPDRLCFRLKKELDDIRYSRVEDRHQWLHKIPESVLV
jgi:branched-chain amino acid aminotransferase